MIGSFAAHFNANCLKPYMFDPVFRPKSNEDPKITSARSKWAFVYSAFVYFLICAKMTALYLYVDENYPVPQQWMDSIIKTCPTFKKRNLWHHFSIVHTGFVIIICATYLWNYTKHRGIAQAGKVQQA